jgi:replicative DNA helicase
MVNESAVICARTGFGKSWWLIFFALQAAKQGLRVGFYSGEMESDLVGYRLDTYLGNIANGSLTHGNNNVKEDYENYLQSLSKVVPGHIYCATPETFDGNPTVSKIRAFIEQYNIEFMCIDQFSLLNDDKHAKSVREQFVNISKDLRALQRLKKIPILSAAQLNRNEEVDNESLTKNLAESDRIGQDATTVLSIKRKGDNVIFTIEKARNAKTGDKLTYNWNTNMGILRYIPSENDARSGKGSDSLEYAYNDSQKSDSVF